MLTDEGNDFFDGEDIEEKTQVETPEQKEAREIKENTIERRPNRLRRWLFIFVALMVLAFGVYLWVRYYVPQTTENYRTGRVMEVNCKGLIFKTYEGQMISEEYIADTTKIYQRDFIFSVPNDTLAKELRDLQGTGKKVTLKYDEYRGILPWRGETNRVVIGYEAR